MEALAVSTTLAVLCVVLLACIRTRHAAAAREAALMACRRTTMQHDLAMFLRQERAQRRCGDWR